MNKNKNILIFCIAFIVGLVGLFYINDRQIKKHTYYTNIAVINLIHEYDLDEQDVLNSLKMNQYDYTILSKYGVDLYEDNILDNTYNPIISNMLYFMVYSTLLFVLYVLYNKMINKRIIDLTYYIEQINRKNYHLDIKSNKDDTISYLQNEIYKTMVYLNNVADLSVHDKQIIKNNLEDITHQIKTPLTAIMINLDNLMDYQGNDETVRSGLIRRISKDTRSIQILIDNLLKLSKFDVNGIVFNQDCVLIKEIIDEAFDKVAPLIDLYDINVIVDYQNYEHVELILDKKWQVEALSNILKNACEQGCSNIKVIIDDNNIYSYIKIINDSNLIDEKAINKVFDRFNPNSNVGIGLALTKEIIETDNGMITVKNVNEGVCFDIKYFKNTMSK